MNLSNLSNDSFEFIENEGHLFCSENIGDCNLDDELNDILFPKSSNSQQIQISPLRPIDLPSHRKHYGLLTFYQYRIPILFRLVLVSYFVI